MKQTTRTLLGLLAPLYCSLLLIGCVYLAHDDWPDPNAEGDQKIARLKLPNSDLDTSAPPDFQIIKNTKERKSVFFNYFEPLIEAENQRMEQMRVVLDKLTEIYADQDQTLSSHQLNLLNQLAAEFSVKTEDTDERLELLDRRVRPLPTALVLAQAATESAWGTSRFARQGNNFFGQWCFSKGCGLVPLKRDESASHEVAKFTSPAHSVRAYFNNLNTFSAYRDFRVLRQSLYAQNQPVTARDLLPGLKKYSERGEVYTKDLARIIRQNRLEDRNNQKKTSENQAAPSPEK